LDFPVIPNFHALAILLLTLLTLVLFAREKIALELTSLFVLVVLVVGFELFPFGQGPEKINASDFFHGFGHEALVAVCALMVAGQALVSTGALEPVARKLSQFWRKAPAIALLMTLVVGAVFSAFMNNTPIVVLMIPMLIGTAVRNKTSTSGVLLPLGLATLVGGMSTTIGTSTNLLVVSVAADMGMEPFQMFDFMVPVLMAGVIALLYLWLIAPRIIPERNPPAIEKPRRTYSAQLAIHEGNSLVDKNLSKLVAKAGPEFHVGRILRGGNRFITPLPDVRIEAGDKLLINDTIHQLQEFKAVLGAELLPTGGAKAPASGDEQQLAEVLITRASSLHGMVLSDVQLWEKFGLTILALHCSAGSLPFESAALRQHKLESSDVLLVQGDSADITLLKTGNELLVLDSTRDIPHTQKAPLALSIMLLVVALAAFGVLPIASSAVLGVFALIATRCLKWHTAFNALSTQVILIIVASLALGSALMKTGGADWLALVFLYVTFGAPPWIVLSGLMLLMTILTNVVSNNAAAVIGTPVGISIAMELGLPLEPFVLAVLFGANLSFITPMAYKTNLLVMNAGGYKFSDFVKAGTPLAILMWLTLSAILKFAYSL
jgi:di/tricarboxylate transporter